MFNWKQFMYTKYLTGILRCPETLKPLKNNGDNYFSGDRVYQVMNNVISVVYPSESGGDDARYSKIYNIFAPLYDLNEKVMGRLLTGVDMVKVRKQTIPLLGLKPGMKILEVSPGPGNFQKFLRNGIGEAWEAVAKKL